MIVQRMSFNIKYGKFEECKSLWDEMIKEMGKSAHTKEFHVRMMRDISGRACTLYEELFVRNFNEITPFMYYWKINDKVQQLYRQSVDLCDTAARDIFNRECESGNVTNYTGMIGERHSFQLLFGKAREGIALWKEIIDEVQKNGGPPMRLCTDLAGPSYTLVVEAYLKNMAEVNESDYFWNEYSKAKQLYQQFIPMCDWEEKDYYKIQLDV